MVRAPTKHFWLHPPILRRITLIPKIQHLQNAHWLHKYHDWSYVVIAFQGSSREVPYVDNHSVILSG